MVRALNGFVVMSYDLERMGDALYNNRVPELWSAQAYPSLKPLSLWSKDLCARMQFISSWIAKGIPPLFWISGFYFPQAFLTGTLQNFARKYAVSIDTVSFDFKILTQPKEAIDSKPEDGCYIHGLFLEGARWDTHGTKVLQESHSRELFTQMPVLWLLPKTDRKRPDPATIYECPLYKTQARAGTLSTTGHSTNYVVTIELRTTQPPAHWIKRGVALLCALSY